MALASNPLVPYQLAVGCSDNWVRIYDQRMLNTVAPGKYSSPGLLTQCTVPSLGRRCHRITSVAYSHDSTELLVSYSSEYIYLFDLQGNGAKSLSTDSAVKLVSEQCSPDTVDCNTVLEGRQLPLLSNTSSSSSSSGTRGPSSPGGTTSAVAGLPSRQPPVKRLRLRGDWSDTGPDARPERERTQQSDQPSGTIMQRMSDMLTRWLEGAMRHAENDDVTDTEPSASSEQPVAADETAGGPSQSASDVASASVEPTSSHVVCSLTDDFVDSSAEDVANLRLSSSPCDLSVDRPASAETETATSSACALDNTDVAVVSANVSMSVDSEAHGCQHAVTANSCSMNDKSTDPDDIATCKSDKLSSDVRPVLDNLSAISLNTDNNDDSSQRPSTSSDVLRSSAMSPAHGECASSTTCSTSRREDDDTVEQDVQRHLAAIQLQKMFRQRRTPNEDSTSMRLPRPQIQQVFRGHRNSRTMIKKATFWGTKYVMSGSDCGHIFIWDRMTSKLVMLLPGDKHVVNCLQPHPYFPVLASSGIDYDVKVWMPMSEEPSFDEFAANELIRRNELMLEETRDTVTVPATFMLRMLASLSNSRRSAEQPSSDAAQ